MYVIAFALVTCLSLVSSSASAHPFSIHEQRTNVAHGWSRVGKPAPNALLPLRIGLKQSNIDTLHDRLLDVSHPDSANYGKHWTAEEVKAYFRPAQDSVDTVMKWLEEAGVERARIELSKGDNWVQVKDFSIAEAEKILNTEYHIYQHIHGACSAYSVPSDIQSHIELITPTLHFDGPPRPKRGALAPRRFKAVEVAPEPDALPDDLSNCGLRTTRPATARCTTFPRSPPSLPPPKTPSGFPSLVGRRPELISIDGGVVQTTEMSFDLNVESNFDLGYSMTLVGPDQPVRLYQVQDIPEGQGAQQLVSFNDLLDALDGSYCTEDGGDDPAVDGTYPDPAPGGYKGPQDCGDKPRSNVMSLELTIFQHKPINEFGKLGLMGITFIVASGDSGVAGDGGLCAFPNGTQSVDAPLFNPLSPVNCPFVTGVGATQINPGSTVFDPESAASLTSGGFSNVFALPDYQKAAVEEYYKFHKPPYGADQYNNSQRARGFPDFSANGVNCTVVADGVILAVAGTSAAPPVIGAMITLINDARLAAGKSPVGSSTLRYIRTLSRVPSTTS
ncbi:Pro-kumamolisin, activation domain-containing protein [Mycena galopus ATCC 62051]|nr:Pro-kumamolisin, activation domain-containing protein [Mycena galopus ATCC 62051]